jgi:uncharacterized protein YdeI (YjbR/CyaY-like superfamily)
MAESPRARFFKSQSEWRDWLEENHDQHDPTNELWVGFYKKSTGKAGITYKEALDEALCYGWIDGVRKSLDDDRWTIRFTPRKPRSIWSAVNLKRFAELRAEGRLHSAGLRIFEQRDPKRSGLYSFERSVAELEDPQEELFKSSPKAWAFFKSQPPSYRRVAVWWVVSAKKEETKQRRLATLIELSEKGERLPQLVSPGKAKKPGGE